MGRVGGGGKREMNEEGGGEGGGGRAAGGRRGGLFVRPARGGRGSSMMVIHLTIGGRGWLSVHEGVSGHEAHVA